MHEYTCAHTHAHTCAHTYAHSHGLEIKKAEEMTELMNELWGNEIMR